MRIELQTELLRRYPKSFREPDAEQLASAFDTWGVECGDGWFALIDRLAGDCERDIEALILQGVPVKLWPRVTQIKEKTGSLRFRVYKPAPTGEPLGKILTLGEEESRYICAQCGVVKKSDLDGSVHALCCKCATKSAEDTQDDRLNCLRLLALLATREERLELFIFVLNFLE